MIILFLFITYILCSMSIYEYAYAIELYIGEKRSGKTLGMVGKARQIIKNNPSTPIYANFTLNKDYFPNSTYITRKELEGFYEDKVKFKNCIFLIDETHLFLDSRRFARKGNLKIGYLIGQMGKRGNVFLGNTHFPRLVDFRLRAYCERWIYVRKGLLINNKFRMILNNNKVLTEKENDMLCIQLQPVIRKLVDYEFHYIHEPKQYLMAKPIFKMYDTEEFINTQ